MLDFHADEVRVDPSPSKTLPENCHIDHQTDLIATSFPIGGSPSSLASILRGYALATTQLCLFLNSALVFALVVSKHSMRNRHDFHKYL